MVLMLQKMQEAEMLELLLIESWKQDSKQSWMKGLEDKLMALG